MKIELVKRTIREIVDGYVDNLEEGVRGLGGALDIRPKYQREFVYNDEQQKAVIATIMKGFPLNVMYWMRNDDGTFELLDGQQRTVSFCKYVANDFSISLGKNVYCFANLTKEEQEKILNYELFIYECEGTDKERLEWFRTINIAGLRLTDQELRNACYTGEWLTSAKAYFSKNQCPGTAVSDGKLKAEVNRQGLLEIALRWKAAKDGLSSIEDYMSQHQHDTNADELWLYFRGIMDWVDSKFKKSRKERIGQPWQKFYEDFKDKPLDAKKLEDRISALLKDPEVESKKGIYPFVLYGNLKDLNLRAFSEDQRSEAYERQKGICPFCVQEGKTKTHYTLSEMQADHIIPWSKGGKTTSENCQMLCAYHNNLKSNH